VVVAEKRSCSDVQCSLFVRQTEEIKELHSQLDKYRTVAAVTFPNQDVVTPAAKRKHRAHGISAEPLALTTVEDIMSASSGNISKSKRKEAADTVKSLVAEIAGKRHPKSPE